MTNVTVQEALKNTIKWFTENCEFTESEVLDLCKAALSDIEKCEPVWYHHVDDNGQDTFTNFGFGLSDETKLYTSPQPRDWVGLSLLRIDEIYSECNGSARKIYAAINDELKQLNTKG